MCPLLTEYGIFLSLPLLSQLSTIMMVTISMRGEVMVMMLKIIVMETTFIV